MRKFRCNGGYGIDEGDPLDEKHLLSILLLIEHGAALNALDMALRESDQDKVAQIAHFARILTETVQCFGSLFKNYYQYCYKALDERTFFTSFIIGIYEPLIAFPSVKLPQSSILILKNVFKMFSLENTAKGGNWVRPR